MIALESSWSYLKEAQRVASDAVQQDIDSPDVVIPPPFWMEVVNGIRNSVKWLSGRKLFTK